nr:hypothetical protein Iba_chr12cCG14740 [Ipomoea batatas]
MPLEKRERNSKTLRWPFLLALPVAVGKIREEEAAEKRHEGQRMSSSAVLLQMPPPPSLSYASRHRREATAGASRCRRCRSRPSSTTATATLPVHCAEKGRPSTPSDAAVRLPTSTAEGSSRPSEKLRREMARRCPAAFPSRRTKSPIPATLAVAVGRTEEGDGRTTRWTWNKKGERRGCGWSSRIPQHRYLPPQGSPEEERRDHVADEPLPATPPPLPLLHFEQRAIIVVCCSHRRDQHAGKIEEQGTITAAAVHLPASTADAGSRPSERPHRETAHRCFAPSPPKEQRWGRGSVAGTEERKRRRRNFIAVVVASTKVGCFHAERRKRKGIVPLPQVNPQG